MASDKYQGIFIPRGDFLTDDNPDWRIRNYYGNLSFAPLGTAPSLKDNDDILTLYHTGNISFRYDVHANNSLGVNQSFYVGYNSDYAVAAPECNASIYLNGSICFHATNDNYIEIDSSPDTINTSYILPKYDGVSGDILTTSGTGQMYWTNSSTQFLNDIIFNSTNVIACYWDEKTTATNGGTFPEDSWEIRELNSFITSNSSYFGINTSSNSMVIKLPGTYMIYASAPGCHVQNHMIRMYNTNTTVIESYGTSAHSVNECTRSFLEKETNIATWTEMEIQHHCDKTKVGWGLGRSSGIPGIPEKYTIVKIIKLENNMATTISYFVLYVYDRKSTGTNGGTFNPGIWQTRNLNTIDTNLSSFAYILNNQIIINPGVYIFSAKVPAHGVKNHMARLYNVTDGLIEVLGTSSHSYTETTYSAIEVFISIQVPVTYEIQHYGDTLRENWGLGKSVGIAGNEETYTSIKIIKMI